MAYNYGPPPGAYGGQQPLYGQPGGGMPGVPPGAGSAFPPGMEVPPGMNAVPPPANLQGHFQSPANMPNINFNAPVIRLGLGDQQANAPADRGGGSGQGFGDGRRYGGDARGPRHRPGLGADRDDRTLDRERAALRENMMTLQPPTREEVARTIYISGLSEGTPGDDVIENILRTAGKLRRWVRAKDSDDNKCKFGFAEYEDVDSLEAATEIFVDVSVPLSNKSGTLLRDEDGNVKVTELVVVVDEQSKAYIEDWKGRRKEDADSRQFRIDGCKEDLRQILAGLNNQGAHGANGDGDNMLMNGDGSAAGEANGETQQMDGAEVVTIPLSIEDELSDIPADMRATVAEEIKAFRDRSVRRDLERVRREEEVEKAERQKTGINRLASPPRTDTPSGPANASVNGAPVGPRGNAQVPSGPKGYRGVQMPSDYAGGVAFVGEEKNGSFEDEDADESDGTLETRRKEQRRSTRAKQVEDGNGRWKNREVARQNAQKRERVREEGEQHKLEKDREFARRFLEEYDDELDIKNGRELFYRDQGAWLRDRASRLDHELRSDDKDRHLEQRETAGERQQSADAQGLADSFLEQTAAELASDSIPQRQSQGLGGFKISLGSAVAKSRAAAAETLTSRRKMNSDVEGLLEDEEDAAASGVKRPALKPLTDLSTAATTGQDMTDEERAGARKQLVAEIPVETSDLFQFPMQWGYINRSISQTQIRPFVEKKVVEYLGVQEDLLVDVVMEALEARKEATELVTELEDALGEEAEPLVRKVWRLVIFWSESEARGLN